ncbi:MAG: aspartate/glutamate/glutamine transport system substrate-binding protein [Chloroflexia bacterium]|nr:aspartate/glutamate/glutamine transport system substrate-binding protein [Chloroflexia bacterium]
MRRFKLLVLLVVAVLALAACDVKVATPTATTAPPAAAPTNTQAGAAPTDTTAAPAPTDTTAAAPTNTTASAPTNTTAAGGTTPTTGSSGGGATNNLAAIKARGKLIAGVKYDVRIFGYLSPETNQVEGFDVDLAKAVATHIFGNPDAIQFEEAISRNRIPYLDEGRVDVIFSTMTANKTRSEQIDFSDVYYVAGQSLLVPVNSDIKSVNDLSGKRVGTAKGSTSEVNIRGFAPGAQIELFDAYAQAVAAMDAGRLDAVTTDDIILYGFARNSPDKFKVVGGQFTQEPYAAGVKKGNTDLLNEVNATLRDLKDSGEWGVIYKRWIGSDPAAIPPQKWEDVYAQAPAVPTLVPEQATTATAGAQSAAATAAAAASPTTATTPTP